MSNTTTLELGGAQLVVDTKALFEAWMEKHFDKPVAHDLTFPALREGERFVGTIVRPDGSGHHIIRMAAEPGKRLNWKDAMAFAAEKGGELPDRPEAALMFATARKDLEEEWYWTREQHAGSAAYAWVQLFGYGLQGNTRKGTQCRVVLVRRVPIESLSH